LLTKDIATTRETIDKGAEVPLKNDVDMCDATEVQSKINAG
jgi:hypothetical protein